ncbi:hypothetical protein Ndes2526B_g02403 [Nannochloris sp. 'desiccata']|nr:hypothetical protein KSW81_003281 [Chlorella desiccata (nom. nud.)]KAH7623103.1 putative Protein NLP2 [Chlorella desiccata (nom. nud.)]
MDLQRKLARTVLGFQDSYLARDNSPVGLLCQVWMPEETLEGALELKTKGMPFCVAGMGDLLALFRCISCRFNFGTDPYKPEILGAPGRVYSSGKPELACNVQQYSRESYLRRAEAEQCRVQSSMLLPVFSIPPGKNSHATVALGVVEVVQTSDDMDFLPVACLLGNVLIRCGLYTSTIEEVKSRMPTAATNLQLPNHTGLLEDVINGGGNDSSDIGEVGSADGDGGDQQQRKGQSSNGRYERRSGGAGGGTEEQGASADVNMRGSDGDELDNDSDEDDNDEGDDYEPGRPSLKEGQRRKSLDITRGGLRKNTSAGTNNSNGKSNRHGGRNAKSGVKLTLADLQGQFGVGLKEAANQLGVCTTTLKRACRRHGIQRWPRRALQKVSRTLDEMERRGTIQNSMVEAVPMGSLMHPTTGQFMIPPPPLPPMSLPYDEMPVDLRWAALANMIPKLHGGAGAFTIQTGAAGGIPIPMPSPSDFSLEGAVTVTHGGGIGGGNDGNGKNNNIMNHSGGNKGNAVTAGTGMTSGWEQVGTAAAAQAAAAQQQEAAARKPQHLAGIVPAAPPVQILPAFLCNTSYDSPFDNLPQAPILQLPGGGEGGAAAPSEGPGMSLPFSHMSLPSFGPSFMMPSSFMGHDGMMPSRASGGNMNTTAAAPIGGLGGGQRGAAMDDVGLLDSTILELMLAEDSRTLVGASDEELKRMFPGPAQAQPL